MDRLEALRLLLDVAERGSFSAAARQRAIATSTVSAAINQLEKAFGARLMTRSTRQLTFTHEGERLLADARRILAEWDAALGGLGEKGPLSGPIRVTATNDFGRTRLRPLLDRFQELHPCVHINLRLDDSTVDVVGERIDIALRSGPLPDSSLRARLLIRGDRLVCASPGYWARAGTPNHPHELKDHNCIVLARPGAPLSPWPFREGGKLFSVKVSGDREASDGDIVRIWAIDGRGVALKNHWDIRNELASGSLQTALDEYSAAQIDLYAVLPGGLPNRRVSALVEFVAEELAHSISGYGNLNAAGET